MPDMADQILESLTAVDTTQADPEEQLASEARTMAAHKIMAAMKAEDAEALIVALQELKDI